MTRAALILSVCTLLVGCNSAKQEAVTKLYDQANSTALAAEQACYSKDQKKGFKSRSEYMACVNDAENFQRPLLKYTDLLDLKFAVRKSLGQKMDSGTLTQADAEVEFQKTVSAIATETQRRDLAARSVAAQEEAIADSRQQQASAALLSAGTALMTSPQPAFSPAAALQSPVRCNSQRLGNYISTNCF